MFAGRLILLHRFNKIIEHKLRILRAAGGFGVELGGEEGLGFVLDALAGAVVEVLEEHGPLGGQRVGIDGEAVVLAGDVAALRTAEAHGLVVAAVAVLQLEGVAARGQAHEL